MRLNRKPLLNNDIVAGKIAGYIGKCKQVTVKLLQRCESRCTLLQKKILLIVFVLLFGGYCACVLLGAFLPKHSIVKFLSPHIITLPVSPWGQYHQIHKPNNH